MEVAEDRVSLLEDQLLQVLVWMFVEQVLAVKVDRNHSLLEEKEEKHFEQMEDLEKFHLVMA